MRILQILFKNHNLTQSMVIASILKLGFFSRLKDKKIANNNLTELLTTLHIAINSNQHAIEVFEKDFGYDTLVNIFEDQSVVKYETAKYLLFLATESTEHCCLVLRHPNFLTVLVQIFHKLDDTSKIEIVTWMSNLLHEESDYGSWNLQAASDVDLLNTILVSSQLENLLPIVEKFELISSTNLKNFLRNLKTDNLDLLHKMTHAILRIAKKTSVESTVHDSNNFFSLTEDPNCSIKSSNFTIEKSGEFSVFLWVKLRKSIGRIRCRRIIFSLLNSEENDGYEAFISSEDILTLVCYCQESRSITFLEVGHLNIFDGNWHALTFIFNKKSGYFYSQYHTTLCIDGIKRTMKNQTFPMCSRTEFQHCSIGGGSSRQDSISVFDKEKIPVRLMSDSGLKIMNIGLDSNYWGPKVSIDGYIGQVYIINESIQVEEIDKFLRWGQQSNIFEADSPLHKIKNNVLVHYHPKAINNGSEIVDISANALYPAKLFGRVIKKTNFGKLLDSIGGIQLLLPVLEKLTALYSDIYIDKSNSFDGSEMGESEVGYLLRNSKHSRGSIAESFISEYSPPVSPTSVSRSSLSLLEENIASCVIGIFKTISTATLYGDNIVILSHLLSNLPKHLIDEKLLMSIEMLYEKLVSQNDEKILEVATECLLFNFRIWSEASKFTVRIGHTQFLTRLIKDKPEKFIKNYGIPYLLQIMKNYATATGWRDSRDIRNSILTIISYYLKAHDSPRKDILALVNFLTVKPESKQDFHINNDLLSMMLKSVKNSKKLADIFLPEMTILIGVLFDRVHQSRTEKCLKIVTENNTLNISIVDSCIIPLFNLILQILRKSGNNEVEIKLLNETLGGFMLPFWYESTSFINPLD